MRPNRATMIVLPVVCLLCTASRAATLGGLEGECKTEENKYARRQLLMMKSEWILNLKGNGVYFNTTKRLHSSNA